ncbi:MAG: type II toxin-antitoxin system PrlF family antitoxin [bacterium]|nr:type II toxin-antitoxin system PrlF family antitoxin [bacterium]
MPPNLEAESTLTDRYQTTVPETIRRALKLGKRDKIRYAIRPNGEVVLTRASQGKEDDPALERFLDLIAQDLASHPERIRSLDAGLVKHIHSLTRGIEVDLDAPLSADDE